MYLGHLFYILNSFNEERNVELSMEVVGISAFSFSHAYCSYNHPSDLELLWIGS